MDVEPGTKGRLCGGDFSGGVWRKHFKNECTGKHRILDNLNECQDLIESYQISARQKRFKSRIGRFSKPTESPFSCSHLHAHRSGQ